jgi:hypothetical protein
MEMYDTLYLIVLWSHVLILIGNVVDTLVGVWLFRLLCYLWHLDTSFVTLLEATTSSTGEESDAATTLTMPGLEDIQHVVGGLWDCEDSLWYLSHLHK